MVQIIQDIITESVRALEAMMVELMVLEIPSSSAQLSELPIKGAEFYSM